ncbi:MAG: helix-turn-helix domain-containing protein [Roseiarcus sp.]
MPHAHIDPILPSDEDASLAKTARLALERSEPLDKALRVKIEAIGREATTLDLPPVVTRLLMDVLEETAAGKAVSLVAVEADVTTQQAAAILNVSRPFVVGLIDKGALPVRMVGNQRRLPLRDVLAYKADNRAKRRAVLAELAAYDQELGLE